MTSAHDKAVYLCNTCVGKGCPECDGAGVRICRRQQSVDVEDIIAETLYCHIGTNTTPWKEQYHCDEYKPYLAMADAILIALRDKGVIV